MTLKFCDSFLYKWAEEKPDKPIIYIYLLKLENPLILKIMKDLRRQGLMFDDSAGTALRNRRLGRRT